MKNKIFGITLIIAATAFTSLACTGGGKGSVAEDTQQAVKIEMVKIPGGTFIMGSPEDEPEREFFSFEETQHTVTVSYFYMGKYPVTEKQFFDVTGYNLSSSDRFVIGHLPVEGVGWYDAIEFCNKLSKRKGLEQVYTITDIERDSDYDERITKATVIANWSKNGYRLPTEAEWEYACRAGTTTAYNTGDTITTEQANFGKAHKSYDRVWNALVAASLPVGSFAPNAFGLYDMHGNVCEWCWDMYKSNYYVEGQINPKGPKFEDAYSDVFGIPRMCRGGSWKDRGEYLRSANRFFGYTLFRQPYTGFRVVHN
ncbi:MAG: formylglycine-generating enzyme family protein [Leptospirales bacterium]|nr:formylglycine-generating enzyme family protein [Leptospirales bacterium]